jgi:hypothetical protein
VRQQALLLECVLCSGGMGCLWMRALLYLLLVLYTAEVVCARLNRREEEDGRWGPRRRSGAWELWSARVSGHGCAVAVVAGAIGRERAEHT